MATLERNNTDVGQASKACVVCNAYQPRDGKFLSCFHVICSGCLAESISCDGSVSCLLCKSDTLGSVTLPGVELGRQLIDSSPILNGGDSGKQEFMDVAKGSNTKSSDSVFCDPCRDINIERNASYLCDDCGDLPLCDMHAEKHPKKRVSSGHNLRPRERHDGQHSSSKPAPSAKSKNCLYHAHITVITYCRTCNRCICAECIAAGSHDGHGMENLADAADKQRTRVAEVFKASGFGCHVCVPDTKGRNSDADNSTVVTVVDANTATTSRPNDDLDRLMSAEHLLKLVGQHIAMVTDDACTASKTVTERFHKIEEMMKRQRDKLLNDIDHLLWTQLDLLEAKKKRLESLLHRQNASDNVVTHLISPTICPEVLLNMAERVVENILNVSKDLEVEQNIVHPSLVFVDPGIVDDIEEIVQEVAHIREGVRPDISKSVLEVKRGVLKVGRGRVVVKLFDYTGQRIPIDQAIPDISSTVILPSGASKKVAVDSEESDSSALVIPISSPTTGKLILEISHRGLVSRSIITVSAPGMSFDPQKCQECITLSDNKKVATMGGGTRTREIPSVIATDGFDSGHHEWSVRVIKGNIEGKHVALGLVRTRSGGNFNTDHHLLAEKPTLYGNWGITGDAQHMRNIWDNYRPYYFKCGSDMEVVRDGDILEFTLDCHSQTLRCVNQRTKQANAIYYINFTQPLHPAVQFTVEGQSVEFLPENQ